MDDHKLEFYLCLFGGWLGVHKYYRKEISKGLLYTFTFGLFFIGWIIDGFNLYRIAFKLSPEELQNCEKMLAERQKIMLENKALRQEKRKEALEKYKAGQEEKRQYEKERLEQLKRDHIPYCPKCHSTQLTYLNKKLSLGRAVVGGAVGGVLTGGLGAAAGATMGGLSSKKGKVKCLNCGHTWKL